MNTDKYRPIIKKLFAQFYANEINKERLIRGLYEVENTMYRNTKTKFNSDNGIKINGLWFRFFNGDTMATTISDLSNDIYCATNHDYIMDKIKTALEKPKGLQIYYS